jgi:hypothetical protein
MRFRCAAGRLDGTWFPRCGLKRENMALWASIGAHRDRTYRSPVLTLVSGVPQRSCTSGKKSPSTPSNWQIVCLYLQTQRGTNLNFCGPKTGSNGPFEPATYLCEHPPGKNGPRRPAGQGQRSAPHRRGHHRVTRGGPPPTTPLGGWSPQVPTTAREAKTRPSSAPGCSHQNQNPNQKTTAHTCAASGPCTQTNRPVTN